MNDGEQAVERELPDVIVLDVMMPVVDGLTVCRRLRARKLTVPALMLTARHEISDRISGLDAGTDDYLVKPFDELLARLRAHPRVGQRGDADRRRPRVRRGPADRRCAAVNPWSPPRRSSTFSSC